MNPTATAFCVAGTYILKVNPTDTKGRQGQAAGGGKGPSSYRKGPYTIVVMDMSGSMGQLPGVVNNAFGEALASLGVEPDEELTYISFNSETRRQTVRHDALRSLPSTGHYNTRIAGVFPALAAVYNSLSPAQDVRIVVFSDGVIDDTQDAIASATRASEQLRPRTGNTTVLLGRIMSSDRAEPDTRAMSYVASIFNTRGDVGIETIDCNNLHNATKAFVMEGFKATQQRASLLTGTGLARFPGDPKVSSLGIYTADPVYVLVDDVTGLLINGQPLDVDVRELVSPLDVEDFVKAASAKIRTDLVANLNQQRVAQAFDFFRMVQEQLDAVTAKTSNSMNTATSATSAKLTVRVAALQSQLAKMKTTCVHRLLALRNVGNMQNLNQAQITDFLTNKNFKIGAGTARRAMKGDTLDELIEACQSEFERLGKANKALSKAFEETDQSFVSQSGPNEYLETATELLGTNPTVQQILSVTGPVGVCFCMQGGQYADPWLCRVDFVGASFFASTADVVGCVVAKYDTELVYPGTTNVVTGVVGLSFINPEAFKVFTTTCPTLLKVLASIFMRNGNIACVPGDVAALVCAVHHRLVLQQSLTNKPTQVATLIMRDLRNQMVGLLGGTAPTSIGAQVAAHLNEANFPAYFTGDLGYGSGYLKPYSVLVSHPLCAALREDSDRTGAVLRYFFVRTCYEARRNYEKFGQATLEGTSSTHQGGGEASSAVGGGGGASSAGGGGGGASSAHQGGGGASREEELEMLLGVNFAEFDKAYPEDGWAPSPTGFGTVDLNKAQRRAQRFVWMQSLEEFQIMHRFVHVRTNPGPIAESGLGGVPSGMLYLGAALVALSCEEESDLVNKISRTCKVNLTADPEATKEHAQRLADQLYTAHYERRAEEKRKQEVAATRQAAIRRALSASSAETFDDDFVGALNEVGITSSSATGYKELEECLASKSWPLKRRKVMTLLTGRNPDNVVVWANGNVCARIPLVFAKFFEETDATRTLATRIDLLRKQQGHVYSATRCGENTNRHGYNTNHQTLMALGFDSFAKFEASDPKAAAMWFKRRVQERRAIDIRKNSKWTRKFGYKTLEQFEQQNPEEYYEKAAERAHLALARQIVCYSKQ